MRNNLKRLMKWLLQNELLALAKFYKGEITMKCEVESTVENVPVHIVVEDEKYVPIYSTKHAAGADVHASIIQEVTIPAGTSKLIPTGIRVSIPVGYEIQVRPRSGLALKHQITVLNSPGTIDADYRGEIGVILINHGKEPFVVTPGMRIAQLVVAPVCQAEFILCQDLTTTDRGCGGFGHTGITNNMR
jgi:dUTP pyrophosphatase